MRSEIRFQVSLTLGLFFATAALAQNAPPPTEQTVPVPPARHDSQTPATPSSPSTPATPPGERAATQRSQAWSSAAPAQSQTAAPPPATPPSQAPATPPLPQYPPPRPQWTQPQWQHSESVYDAVGDNRFHYHPFAFHIDAGGTITQRASENNYDNGWNVGAGFTWYPTSLWQIGIRVDGTYSEFDARSAILQQASSTYGTPVTGGRLKMWGGDTDLEIDLPVSPYFRFYLLAGGGWYRQQTTYRQTQLVNGYICFWFGCESGYFGVTHTVARYNTDWRFAKNAGFGMDLALGPRASFFVEARYMRLNPASARSDFLPIRAGFRF